MLDKPSTRTAVLSALIGLLGFGLSRRYPASRLLIAVPLAQAALLVFEAVQQEREVTRKRRLGGRGALADLRRLL